jgi:hypothetical protein
MLYSCHTVQITCDKNVLFHKVERFIRLKVNEKWYKNGTDIQVEYVQNR